MLLLRLLDKHAPNNTLMQIRTTDISKRPKILLGEKTYSNFCDDLFAQIQRGTQDSIRKNFFPDLHRMNFINRYDKHKKPIPSHKRYSTKFVSLSALGTKLISFNLSQSHFLYTKGLNNLFDGRIEIILELLRYEDTGLKTIRLDEYQFFVSAIDIDTTFSIGVSSAAHLIRSYRKLGKNRMRLVRDTIVGDLQPNKKYPKNEQRDYGNWRNEASQVFHLLNQTVYFHADNTTLKLADPQNSPLGIRLSRSNSQKSIYFAKHKLKKNSDFEMHHIIPLATAESKQHFKLLDNWKNMLYINALHHATITKHYEKSVILDFDEGRLLLTDPAGNRIALVNKTDVLYDTANQNTMIKYNRALHKHGS